MLAWRIHATKDVQPDQDDARRVSREHRDVVTSRMSIKYGKLVWGWFDLRLIIHHW